MLLNDKIRSDIDIIFLKDIDQYLIRSEYRQVNENTLTIRFYNRPEDNFTFINVQSLKELSEYLNTKDVSINTIFTSKNVNVITILVSNVGI